MNSTCNVCGYTLSPLAACFHAPGSAACLSRKFNDWVLHNGYIDVGPYDRLLTLAGVIRRVPRLLAEQAQVTDPNGEVAWADYAGVLAFRPVAPVWAVEIARRFDYDVPLIRSIEGHRDVKNKSRRWARRAGVARDTAMRPVLPLAMRVRILRVCAANPLSREFAADDLGALAVMVGAR